MWISKASLGWEKEVASGEETQGMAFSGARFRGLQLRQVSHHLQQQVCILSGWGLLCSV